MGKILKLFLKNRSNIAITLLVVVLGIGMVILVPFVLIFALRLLGLETQYSIGSWFGAIIILSIISASPSKKGE